MARFTISGDHLYTVSNNQLKVFSISQAANPVQTSTHNLGFGIETIFPKGNYLFIGSQTGMQIFDNSNPSHPEWVSTYTHIQSCDPVVVEGNYAYVTLRDGNTCRNGQNLLDVIDISNISQPTLVQSYPMQNPHGLGIDGSNLFICEGDFGLKVFDATDPKEVKLRKHIKDMRTFDVIPNNKLLLVVGQDGLYQYDYAEADTLKLLSKISIEN